MVVVSLKDEATNLETCHFKKSRPEIFKISARKFKTKSYGLFSYDLYKIFEDFLLSHKIRKSICFLCKEHHTELDTVEKHSKSSLNKYIKNIIWDL